MARVTVTETNKTSTAHRVHVVIEHRAEVVRSITLLQIFKRFVQVGSQDFLRGRGSSHTRSLLLFLKLLELKAECLDLQTDDQNMHAGLTQFRLTRHMITGSDKHFLLHIPIDVDNMTN